MSHSLIAPIEIAQMTVEGVSKPMSLGEMTPRFSWILTSARHGVHQSSYQILVSKSRDSLKRDIGDCWNSGLRQAENTLYVKYEGIKLQSRQHYYWKVKSECRSNASSVWSEVGEFEMGLLSTSDWQGKWIGFDGILNKDENPTDHFTRVYARYLKKQFFSQSNSKRAIVYISAVGLFQLYVNGKKVGQDVLQPGPTDYAKRVFYERFDITKLVKKGTNEIVVVLGNGRFVPLRQHLDDTTNNCVNYGFPKLLFQLESTDRSNKRTNVYSDSSWKISADGPIGANNEFDGEEYDARRSIRGVGNFEQGSTPHWRDVQIVSPAAPEVVPQLNPAIKIMETVGPKSSVQIGVKSYIYDFKQNMVGWAQIRVHGHRGDTIRLRFAERLDDSGHLFVKNLGDARATDIYIMSGRAMEVWEPSFTYHGFQYMEISGLDYKPTLSDITGKVIHDDLPITGQIETSSQVLNRIYHNMYWGIRGNYRGMPTDCPQRDERMGWLGDRSAVALGESFMFNIHGLYAKWMQDIEDAQTDQGSIPDVAPAYWRMYTNNTTWPAAYVYCIRMLYQQYGDDRPIRLHYSSIKRWLTFLRMNFMQNGIITENTYGDWCVPPESLNLIFSNDSTRKTPGSFLSSAFYCNMLEIMTQFADILQLPKESADYCAQWNAANRAFNQAFFNLKDTSYANNTTTADLLAVSFDLVPEQYRTRVFSHVVDNTLNKAGGHISTGLVGIQQLMRTITSNGRPDLALQLATTTTYPSWGYMLTQGASTIWELWNGNTASPEMNSANHVMMIGDLLTWYYEDLVGIKAAGPGFSTISMHPLITDSLRFVRATFNSAVGKIVSRWELVNREFKWVVEIPANVQARLYLPCSSKKNVMVNHQPIQQSKFVSVLGHEKDRLIVQVQSGTYVLNVQLNAK